MKDDVISRQAAINALGDKPLAWTEGEYELGLQNQWQSDVDALKELPSVQSDWEELLVICDVCGHAIRVKRLTSHNQGSSGRVQAADGRGER